MRTDNIISKSYLMENYNITSGEWNRLLKEFPTVKIGKHNNFLLWSKELETFLVIRKEKNKIKKVIEIDE